MRLLVVSHKHCWVDPEATSGYATDGGFSTQIGALASLFDGVGLCAPCSDDGPVGGLTPIPEAVRVHPLPWISGPLWRRRLRSLGWLERLVGHIRRADAVHCPVPGDVGTLGLLVALAMRKPVFVRHCATWRRPVSRADRMLRRLLERRAGGRVVVMSTGHEADAPSATNETITWIFSSSIREADLRERRTRTAPARGTGRLVTGGRLIVEKGSDTALRAFAELRAQHLAESLDVVGDGPFRASLASLATELGIVDHVTFHGRLARSAVLDVLERADLFVYPTRSSEGFPKLVLEALAAGLPVVATPVSAIPVMIDGAGAIVGGDPRSVADAAGAILSDASSYRAFSTQAIANASRYTLEAWVAAIGERLTGAWGPLRSPTVPQVGAGVLR